ncbi:YadA-like family protein [Fusobacterium sp. SYSU M8A802]
MNKKFMLAALLVLASSLSYAKVGDANFSEKFVKEFNKGLDSSQNKVTNIKQIRGTGKVVLDDIQKEFKNTGAEIDRIDGNIESLENMIKDETTNRENQEKVLNGKIDDLNGKVDQNIDRIDTNVESLENMIKDETTNRETQDRVLNGKIDDLNGKVDQNIDRIDTNVESLENMIKDETTNRETQDRVLNGKIDDLNASKADKADVDKVKNDLNDVKENADTALQMAGQNREDIGNLQSELGKTNSNVQANKDAIAQNKTDIQANKDAIAQNKTDIQANKEAIANKVDKEQYNKDKETQANRDTEQDNRIESLKQDFAQYDGRISGLEKKVDNLDKKMNKGLSLMAAMAAVDFQHVEEGEMSIGAGIGHYGNAQSVAVGASYSPTQDLNLNVKLSVTAGDIKSSAVGAGASYKFKMR